MRPLNDILADFFDLDPAMVAEDMGPDNVEGWDSVKHVQLVLALEGEYGLTLPVEEAMNLLTVADIRAMLAQHGVTA